MDGGGKITGGCQAGDGQGGRVRLLRWAFAESSQGGVHERKHWRIGNGSKRMPRHSRRADGCGGGHRLDETEREKRKMIDGGGDEAPFYLLTSADGVEWPA